MSAGDLLQRIWYGPAWLSLPLWPLSLVFRLAVATRRGLYRAGVLRQQRADVPVIVVGNLTVGGTGKTPIAAWLGRQLTLRGRRVGVVLRGYGGRHTGAPRVVVPSDDATDVGDEALVHARRGPHVVVIGADRVAAARLAVEHGAQLVVCDDGLQHLGLARDYEVAVVDAVRGLGNGWLLPAGPLREPAGRLEAVDAVVRTRRVSGRAADIQPRRPFVADARLELGVAVNLRSGEQRDLASFRGRRVHALAAVGNPEAFFAALRAAGIPVEPHALPDHASLDRRSPPFPADATVLMTEKDAVKCMACAQPDWWYVDLDVTIERDTARDLLAIILERTGLTGAGVKLG
ncbi:MAG: tetraacyldisaccharide 4'-kinase [Gammaproteobacteria bacterium]|nr:tetraacyldisaccharide 4'-kinase [Gammaproteobacteria bacterium]